MRSLATIIARVRADLPITDEEREEAYRYVDWVKHRRTVYFRFLFGFIAAAFCAILLAEWLR